MDASTRPDTNTSTPAREPLDVVLKLALAHVDKSDRAFKDADRDLGEG